MRFSLSLLLVLFFVSACIQAADNQQLQMLRDADQLDRMSAKAMVNWRELNKRDEERRKGVLSLLRSGQIQTAQGYYNAALVLQHGDSAEDIRLAHSLSTVSATLDPENKQAKWLMAASWDRLMLRLKQPQWYGTQYTKDASGKFVLYPAHPDAVTDADRAALATPTLAEAQEKMNRLNGSR